MSQKKTCKYLFVLAPLKYQENAYDDLNKFAIIFFGYTLYVL